MKKDQPRQRILVLQQNGSAESKILGIRRYGDGRFHLEVRSIDEGLPPIVDDPEKYLPLDMDADLVLDFLQHPDLSYGLARLCQKRGIPVIARGRKWRIEGVATPPT
jgi:hypothetical protein